MELILQQSVWIQWALMLTLGCLYGGLIGLIPSAGPGKAVILLYSVIAFFDVAGGEYLFVLFSIATVVSCSIGDSFAGVLIGIPGASGAAATMVDGFPLAKKGKASYALSSAIFCSTINGLLFGAIGFSLFPFYKEIGGVIGIPEIVGLIFTSFALISVVTTKHTIRSLTAIFVGCCLATIGYGPDGMGLARNTLGWEYLEDGISLLVLGVGLFALPELIQVLKEKTECVYIDKKLHNEQTWQGIVSVWKHKWLALMGGIIGWITGLIPSTGGGIGDWAAYSATVGVCKGEKFGDGNIKGIIGSEGANNSGKIGGLLPTIMFGIPGNKMYAYLMALWVYLGFEVGSTTLLEDTKFIDHLFWGYMLGTGISGFLMIWFARHVSKILYINPLYWAIPMMVLIVWSVLASNGYISLWEDIFMLILFGLLGMIMKNYKFSRPAFLMSFILFPRIESSLIQLQGLHFFTTEYILLIVFGMNILS
tara:strand:- start:59 stop:1495 length:1437 start_codon:yes stop_codon:yes gene_type:complete